MTTAAIIGCGDVSIIHTEALAEMEEVTLVGVCDPDPDRLASAAQRHGVEGFADHLSLLDAVKPDVVHLCTPHNQHASLAIDCLERGVNVIVEKPLAHTIDEGQRLVQAAEQHTAKIAVCFQNRYNVTAQAMHRLLTSGDLGAVLGGSFTVVWHRSADYYLNGPGGAPGPAAVVGC